MADLFLLPLPEQPAAELLLERAASTRRSLRTCSLSSEDKRIAFAAAIADARHGLALLERDALMAA